jgi:hypothetical protein
LATSKCQRRFAPTPDRFGSGITDRLQWNPHLKRSEFENDGTFGAQVDGTLTIVREKSPTSFMLEQTVQSEPERQTNGMGQEDKPDTADRSGL